MHYLCSSAVASSDRDGQPGSRYEELVAKSLRGAAESQPEAATFPHGLLPNDLAGLLLTAHENVVASKVRVGT